MKVLDKSKVTNHPGKNMLNYRNHISFIVFEMFNQEMIN